MSPPKKKMKINSTRDNSSSETHKFDLLIFIAITLIAIATVYSNITPAEKTKNSTSYKSLPQIVEDGQIDNSEAKFLSSLDCEEIKKFLGENKSACIYISDEEGNKIPLREKIFIGCNSTTCRKISKGT